jgi:raffinose/stachyose/melibiose transport system permease protein
VLSEVNTAIMWMLLYNADPDRGFLNAILVMLGLQPIAWMADMNVVMYAVFITLTWKYFGFHMLLYLTGLQNIPREIEEAALIDGASPLQNFFYITLPLLGSTIKTSVYMSVLGSIQQFIIVWVMTRWTGKCQRNHGDVHVSIWFCAISAWLWIGSRDYHVHLVHDLLTVISGTYSKA